MTDAIAQHLRQAGFFALKNKGRIIRHSIPASRWQGEFFWVTRDWGGPAHEYFECKTLTEALLKAEEWGML